MKLMLALCLVALCWCSTLAQTCTEIDNCNSCSNPGPQCVDCPARTVVNAAKDDCLPCGDFCTACTADADDNVQCTTCSSGYYLDANSACTTCGDGCLSCAMVDDVLTCSECMADRYTQNADAAGTPCVECDSNCQTCSMASDGTSTICSRCFTFAGQDLQGYYYKTADAAADRSCKTCGSKASACSDDGTGSAAISSCYSGYEVKSDSSKCLACPATCASCNGEELSGSATCTACVANQGVFLTDGQCFECTENCDTCEDSASCAECDEGYRVDGGSCEACPGKCLQCSVDEESGNDVCAECVANYGAKETTSITCDKCTISNCQTCTMSAATGVHSCTTCKDGYGLKDGACTACDSGCKTCEWNSGTSIMGCNACDTDAGYSLNPLTSNLAECAACSLVDNCIECSGADDTPTCSACGDSYEFAADSASCVDVVANCATYLATGACETCAATFFLNSGACDSCSEGCSTCSAADTCTACVDGYEINGAACVDCGVSKCTACTLDDTGAVEDQGCTACESGYAVFNSDGSSTDTGGQCKKCATGCDECTWDYDNNVGTCDTCIGGYTAAETGTCEPCPQNCDACEYTDSTVVCTDGECADGYAKNANSGECDICPENCDVCAWDSDASAVVCTDCAIGYGIISGGACDTCPGNCDECSVADTDAAPDLLTCDTCSAAYAKNEAVCAACSANCVSCEDDEGTMVCTSCKDGFALDSATKECVSCFTNCEECTANNGVVKCTDCNSRYALAADSLSCIICSEAAFENCVECSDVDAESGTATCEDCNTGFVLQDSNPEGPCIDVSSLSCSAQYRVDLPPICSDCADQFAITDDGLCAIGCYVCGDLDTMTPVAQDQCNIPEANSTETAGFATIEECYNGICVAYWSTDNMIVSGCARAGEDGTAPTCPEDNQQESCEDTTDAVECEQCCEGSDLCNTFITTMDGKSAATTAAASLLLLLVTAALTAAATNY